MPGEITLPSHISEALGVPTPVACTALPDLIDPLRLSELPFALSPQELATAITEASPAGGTAAFRISTTPQARAPKSWRSMLISIGGVPAGEAVLIPEQLSSVDPPTAASRLLAKAWVTHPGLLNGTTFTPSLLVELRFNGATRGDFCSRFFQEWSEACNSLEGAASLPPWVAKTEFTIQSSAKLFAEQPPLLRYQGLLLQTIAEAKPRWRFLSLYRVLEHGYLDEVFAKLSTNFFLSPEDSLKEATQAVQNEVKQFTSLVDSLSLRSQLENFLTSFEAAKSASNNFALAIDHSLANDRSWGSGSPDRWRRGVIVCYKIRCAIVHAGLSAPIFESFEDGSDCLIQLLPALEDAVVSFLGATFQ